MRVPFTGIGTALVTPFTSDGTVDPTAVRRLVRRQIDAGIHFLSPCGTTGEAPTLGDAEKLDVVRLVVDETAGRVPVLAGAGGNNTREVVALAREIERTGADGILSVTPYYNKPTPEGLFQHYKAIAEATTLPIVLYNVPGRTGVNLDVATVARLAQLPTIVGLKEAAGNLTQLGEILAAVPSDFIVVSGDDPLAVASMAAGARGLISVASNALPAEMTQLIELCERGELDAARRLEEWLMPFLKGNFVESSPIPIKSAMAAMGLLEEVYRLPLVPPSPPARAKILQVLQDLKLLGSATRL
jgi:4-hydroxy-tetrahydrodipicolinate synthase